MRRPLALSLKNLSTFVKGDGKNILRDPLMMLVLFVPFLLYAMIVWGIPFIDSQITQLTTLQLSDHMPFIHGLALTMTPLMVGMVTGFLLLDEKDEGVFDYFAITPIQKEGFLAYRMSIPVLLAFVFTVTLSVMLVKVAQNTTLLLLSFIQTSLTGPLMTLYLASFAKNKVEGMAIAKVFSILMVAPVCTYLFSEWWVVFAYIVPITWSVELYYFSLIGNGYGLIQQGEVLFIGGLLVYFLWMFIIFRRIQ
ncbi:hypothetical protein [Alteribacter populi]|uniref:hypothetical protein n=1 Tax=Alteribacter populi TaxID=2011011 RepID=UPI000BBB0E50|nr:hypothetical protein [Alteribacter populi]